MVNDIYIDIDYRDPVDGLTKSLSWHIKTDHVWTPAEIETWALNEAEIAIGDYKLAALNITDVSTLIDMESLTYFQGSIP